MDDLVWYACYGSNLLKSRFLCYIYGGKPIGASKRYLGCSDRTLPQKNKQFIIPHELYFSKESKIWENKGVAFIKVQKNVQAKTLGRMYLISKDQFIEIVRQENSLPPNDTSINIDFEATIVNGESKIQAKWYSRILHIGTDGTYPIFTFTAGWPDTQIVTHPPGDKYLKTIIRGINETYNLTYEQMTNYLLNVPGIKDRIKEETLEKIIAGSIDRI